LGPSSAITDFKLRYRTVESTITAFRGGQHATRSVHPSNQASKSHSARPPSDSQGGQRPHPHHGRDPSQDRSWTRQDDQQVP